MLATLAQKNSNDDSGKAATLRMTMWWMRENYEYCESVSIPRKTLYENYQRFCFQYNFEPISSATFGKIIRQQFPQITTRRLGVRGQSKYHYHGLAVKASSSDYDPAFSKDISLGKEAPSFNILHPKNRAEFIPMINISMPNDDDVSEDKIKSDLTHFLVMYTTHSQQILELIIQGSFKEVENCLRSFWRGCPDNFRYLFDNHRLISCVVDLDIQVYISVSHSVLPSMDQRLPDIYLNDFVVFLCNMSSLIAIEISDSNYELKTKKLKYVLIFKDLCLNWLRASHLLQVILPIIKNTEFTSQILDDFQNIVLDDIVFNVTMVMPFYLRPQFICHFHYHFEELENIMENDFSVVEVVNWCNTIYKQCYIKDFRNICLGWSSFFSTFLQHLFVDMSSSFAHTHLLFIWIEHLLYTTCILTEFKNFKSSFNKNEILFESNISNLNAIDFDTSIFRHRNSEMKYQEFMDTYEEQCREPLYENKDKIFWSF